MPPRSKLTLTGAMAQHARNVSAPGLVLPKIKDYQLKTFGWDSDRDPTVIHPSEMAKPNWCLLATYRRIVSGAWPPDPGKYDWVRENIFAAGNYIHEKYQTWMIEAGFPVWGDWRCIICNWRVRNCHQPPDETSEGHDHIWRYEEVTLDAKDQLLIAGHADVGVTGDDFLVEIKSIGLGTVRIDAPDLLERYQDDKRTDLTGLWKAINKPLKSHLKQGDIYLHLARVLGLPFKRIVYLYEFKPNQLTREFTVSYDEQRSMKLIAKAEHVMYAVEHGNPPACVKGPGGCKECNAFPTKRRTVAGTRPVS